MAEQEVDVKLLLINTLNASFKDYPVYLQGSVSVDAVYPDNFFTYWNNDTSDEEFYDNVENRTDWDFDLNFYSNNPTLVNSVLVTAKAALKAVGFIVDGSGYDVLSDEPTHTGRGINLIYMQRKVR